MAAVASQPPSTFLSGFTQDNAFQPLNEAGTPNPFFYHVYADDFGPYRAGDYTVNVSGTGAAIAGVAGDGGIVQLSAGTTAGVTALQQPFAGFNINVLPKKTMFLLRMALSQWAAAGLTMNFGLIQTTATPGTVTDGVYFSLSATGVLSINSAVGSVITTVAIPTAAYTFSNNASFDFGINVTRSGDVLAFVDTQLVGFIPQSNLATPGNPQNAGAVARITGPSLTTATLNPTVGFTQAGTVAVTAKVDFMGAFRER